MAVGESLQRPSGFAEQSMVAYTDQRGTMTMKSDANAVCAERAKASSRLDGARLTSVQFVLDYLILGFDERGALTTLVWPEMYRAGEKLAFGMPGYRDGLCSLIETVTKSARIGTDETLCIDFEDETEMRIPLQSYKEAGERAILTGPKNYLLVL